jgi:hypothetical protein
MTRIFLGIQIYPQMDPALVIGEMVQLATQLQIDVKGSLTGISITARPFCNAAILVNDFRKAMDSKGDVTFVTGKGMAEAVGGAKPTRDMPL